MIKDINAITPEYMKHRIEEETQQYKQEIERLKEELEYTIPIVEHNKTITKHLKEIERLNNGLEDIKWYMEKNKTSFSDLYIPASDVVSILVIIDRLLGSDKE